MPCCKDYWRKRKKNMKRLAYIVIHGVVDGYYEIDSVWSDEKTANKVCDRLNTEIENKSEFGVGLFEVKQEIIKPRSCYKD